jgi:hypothetical protein
MAVTENGLPFPKTDYDKNGNLKTLRGRVVKKLLKYEFQWYGKIVLPCIIGLFAFSLFLLLTSALLKDKEESLELFITMPMILYVYAIGAIVTIPVVLAIIRYTGGFFKGRAYQTLTLPVSVEEHVFSKRFTACVNFFAAVFSAVVCGIIGTLALSENPLFSGLQFELIDILNFIEGLLLLVVITVFCFNLIAALTCFFRSFSGGKRALAIILTIVGSFLFLQTFLLSFARFGVYDILYGTPLVQHISRWLTILLFAGLSALCLWYEIRTLKRNVRV